MDDDDWGLTAEQLDFLEEDAIRKISQKNASSSLHHSPCKPYSESPCTKAEAVPPAGFNASDTLRVAAENRNTGNLLKLDVRFFLHSTGVIAAKFSYNAFLVDAIRKVPKATWLGKERLWVFPISSLTTAEEAFNRMTSAVVEVHGLDPLVSRALHAASAVSDLRGCTVLKNNFASSLGAAGFVWRCSPRIQQSGSSSSCTRSEEVSALDLLRQKEFGIFAEE